jgi:hypothetical protein
MATDNTRLALTCLLVAILASLICARAHARIHVDIDGNPNDVWASQTAEDMP